MQRGLFISFEGIDGCGKSTQFTKSSDFLFKYNKSVNLVLTREPYKDLNIRKILHEDVDVITKASLLADLFIKDREHHVKELISPELEQGKHVLTDRYKLSTIAYQTAQGLNPRELIAKHARFPIPDITFIIDLPAEKAAERMAKESREKHKLEANLVFMEKVRQQFLLLPSLLSQEKIIVIDGSKTPEEIFQEIKSHLELVLKEYYEPKI